MGNFTEVMSVQNSMGGVAKIARTGDVKIPILKSLPAGKDGAIGAVVDTTTTIDGLATGHGITTDDVVGVFWTGGLRLGMTVTAVAANSITVTTASGTGTALPAEDTAVVVSVRVLEDDVGFDGTAASLITACAGKRAGVELLASGGGSVLSAPIDIPTPAANQDSGEGFFWASGLGVANPMSGAVASISAYNGSTTDTTLTLSVLVA